MTVVQLTQFGVDTIAAFGTVSAVLVALGIAVADSRRRDRAIRDAEAAHARLVVLFPQPLSRSDNTRGTSITNNNAAAITDVRLHSARLIRDGAAVQATFFKIGVGYSPPNENLLETLLEPSTGTSFWLRFLTVGDQQPVPLVDDDQLEVTVAFTDPVGFRWTRRGSDEPRRVVTPRPTARWREVLASLGMQGRGD